MSTPEYNITIVETVNKVGTAITDMKPIDDPFIRAVIRPARKLWWSLLFGKLEYVVMVRGNKDATAYVMTRAGEEDEDRSYFYRGANDEGAVCSTPSA